VTVGPVISPAGRSESDRLAELYDLESHVKASTGGIILEDPYPALNELRAEAAIHRGTVTELLGLPPRQAGLVRMFPPSEHDYFSAFSFEAIDAILRDNETYSSKIDGTKLFGRAIIHMVGDEHRRYRTLVQPAFSPKRAKWWVDRWIDSLVDEAFSAFEARGTADLGKELCARIPLQTITASFGMSREEALDFREWTTQVVEFDNEDQISGDLADRTSAVLARIINERREVPQDDIISLLVQSEVKENGSLHVLTDEEIHGFARLLLTAGSGTTWRQLSILLFGLLRDEKAFEAVRKDRDLLWKAIDEAMRWEANLPVGFFRLVTRDVDLYGVPLPAGSLIELCLGAGNRDPERWSHPDDFDIFREPKANLAFAGGPHVCLGMHLARAEMFTAATAVIDRLPNVRIDPSRPAPRIIGLYKRGVSELPVRFDA
jgi:cytochrome P450